MTAQTFAEGVGVRPDVRAEAHSHRRPHRVQLRSPLWLLFLLLVFAVSAGGLFVVASTLAAGAYTAPPVV